MSQVTRPHVSVQTIEELGNQVADLQNRLTILESKLPFENMAAFILEANDGNMTSGTEDGVVYHHHKIRIDHPLSNNNPKAVILVVKLSEKTRLQPSNVFFDEGDGFWYISVPDIQGKGFAIDIIIDAQPTLIEGVASTTKPALTVREKGPFKNAYGVAYAGPSWPVPGEKFSVLIFNEMLIKMKPPVVEPPPVVVKPAIITFSGEWNYLINSASGASFTGKAVLNITESGVTGEIVVEGSPKSGIAGTFINGVLSLFRDTGLETVQVMQLSPASSNMLSGTYVNQGKFLDSGTVTFTR